VSLKFKCLPYFASEIKRSAIALGIFAPLVALDVWTSSSIINLDTISCNPALSLVEKTLFNSVIESAIVKLVSAANASYTSCAFSCVYPRSDKAEIT